MSTMDEYYWMVRNGHDSYYRTNRNVILLLTMFQKAGKDGLTINQIREKLTEEETSDVELEDALRTIADRVIMTRRNDEVVWIWREHHER